jgi:hypothetical protein
MQNNYFSYSSNKKKNIVLISFSLVISIIIFFLVGAVLYAQKWEDTRLVNESTKFSDIPILDKNGLDYFVEIKGQNIGGDIATPSKGE